MRKRGSGHQNKGAEGREMGFIGLITHSKSGKNRRRGQSFLAIFWAWKTASYSGKKHGKPQSIPSVSQLYRIQIPNTLQLSFTPLP
jgi:hypothetical protein